MWKIKSKPNMDTTKNCLLSDHINGNISINNNYNRKELFALSAFGSMGHEGLRQSLSLCTTVRMSSDSLHTVLSFVSPLTREIFIGDIISIMENEYGDVKNISLHGIIETDDGGMTYVLDMDGKFICNNAEIMYCNDKKNYYSYYNDFKIYLGETYHFRVDRMHIMMSYDAIFENLSSKIILRGHPTGLITSNLCYHFDNKNDEQKAKKLYKFNIRLFEQTHTPYICRIQ